MKFGSVDGSATFIHHGARHFQCDGHFFLNICANNFDKIYLNNIIIFINYS